ncbi:helix-turn-helix transcriptional regulator [Methylobacterium sp. JK268]
MLLSQAELSDLIGRIYDCGQDAALWPDTLARLIEALGASAGWIGVQDPESRTGRLAVAVGLSPDLRARFGEHYVGTCPLSLALVLTKSDAVLGLSDIVDRDAFRDSSFYRDWCLPQRVEDLIAGPLNRSSAACGSLSASFDRPASAEARDLMTLLLPHVRRAVETGNLLAEQSGAAECLSAALDALSLGVVLLDAGGRVLRTNAAAEAILRAGDALLRLPAGTLAACDPRSQAALDAALASCREGTARPPAALPFPSRRGAAPRSGLVGQVVPLRAESCPETGRRAVAALFVQDPEHPCMVPGEALVRLYGLTQGELRVLRGLLQDLTLSEIAECHGIGVATVRTHLARLFDKTGTRRQAELLRAVMAAAPAIRLPETRGAAPERYAAAN